MKPAIEKLQIEGDSSIYVKTHATPLFEAPWHHHVEYELVLMKKTSGLSFIGGYSGEFEDGDIYFIGSNVPHAFNKRHVDMIGSALVIQFDKEKFGAAFNDLIECKSINMLYAKSMFGLKIVNPKDKNILRRMMKQVEKKRGYQRLIQLFECLDYISNIDDLEILTTKSFSPSSSVNKTRIDKVIDFTIDSFRDKITLNDVAEIVSMSIPAFCKLFKKTTKKTYIDYLNEVRIGNACNLLLETDMNITQVAYSSGYNTLANFHKQFLRLKKKQPFAFRKQYLSINDQNA